MGSNSEMDSDPFSNCSRITMYLAEPGLINQAANSYLREIPGQFLLALEILPALSCRQMESTVPL